MPPRTGSRRKRRTKQSAPRHFVVITGDGDEVAIAHRLELDDGHLVLRDQADAIFRIFAAGDWREIRPAEIADISYPEDDDPAVSPAVDSGISGTVTRGTREEPDRRFVPASPEEAQRILMELERRLKPDYQDPPDCESNAPPVASTPPAGPRKD